MSNQNEVKELSCLLFDENEDGSLDNIVEYNKDEHGNIVAISLDFDGDGVTDAKAYLEYDEQGRIVKKSMDKNRSQMGKNKIFGRCCYKKRQQGFSNQML